MNSKMPRPPEVPLTRGVAGAASLLAATAGVGTLFAWWRAGWQRSAFHLDFGGPMAPITAILVAGLGLAALLCAVKPDAAVTRRIARASVWLSIAASILLLAREAFDRGEWGDWWAGRPDFIGFLPIGQVAPMTVGSLFLAALGLAFAAGLLPASLPVARTLSYSPLVGLGISFVVGAGYVAGPVMAYTERIRLMSLPAAVTLAALHLALLLLGPIVSPPKRMAAILLAQSGPPDAFRVRLVGAAAGITALVLVLGGFYLRDKQADARARVREQLEAVASVKTTQVADWRKRMLAQAAFLRETPRVASDVLALVDNPERPSLHTRVTDWLGAIMAGSDYESGRVLTPAGETLLALPPDEPAPAIPEGLASLSAREGVAMTRVHSPPDDPLPHMEVLVPIRRPGTEATSDRAAAWVCLRVNIAKTLFPLVREWPSQSESGEILLVSREGREARYISPFRFRALSPRPPSIHNGNIPTGTGTARHKDVIEERDYRGALVLETVHPVPDSPWSLVVKLDRAEAYAPVREEAGQAAALAALLLVSVVSTVAFLARERQAALLARAVEADRQRGSIAHRLALVTEHANDAIVLFDGSMRVLETNARILALHGRTPEESRGLRLPDFHPAEMREKAEQTFRRIYNSGVGDVIETMHVRKDGSLVPVEVSARPVMIDGEKCQLAVLRDISVRKRHEAEIERLNRLYAVLSHVSGAIVRSHDRDSFLQSVCDGLVQEGHIPMAWIAWQDPATGRIEPVAQCGDRDDHLKQVRERMGDAAVGPAGRAIATNETFACAGHEDEPRVREWHTFHASFGFLSALSVPIREEGRAVGALTVYADDSNAFGSPEVVLLEKVSADVSFGLETLQLRERSRDAEEALRKSEERLRLVISGTRQGLYDFDVRAGRIVVTPEYARMLGYEPEDFEETPASWAARLHPDDRAAGEALYLDCLEGRRTEYRTEYRLQTADGSYRWVLALGQVAAHGTDGRAWRIVGAHIDVSDRKAHEDAAVAAQNRAAALVAAIPDLLFEMDLEGRYLSAHAGNEALLAAPAEQLIGRLVSDVLPEEAAREVLLALREAHESGHSLGRQAHLPLPEGSHWFEFSVARVGAAGMDERFVLLSRDITSRKRFEDELRVSLREKEALLKEVHHRVKNNLQVIASLLRMEARRTRDDGVANVLREMQGRIRSMALVHESLYRSQNFSQVELAEYLRQVAVQLLSAYSADARGITLRLDLTAVGLPIDQAIPCGLIMNELITNALKYAFSAGGGEIRVTLGASADLVELTLADTGPGLPPDFETRRGSALGLQLVSDLARQLAGTLTIEPRPARFIIRFPLPRKSRPEDSATLA